MLRQQENPAPQHQPPRPQVPISAEDYRKTYNEIYGDNYDAAIFLNLYPDETPKKITRRIRDISDWLMG